MTTPFSWNNPYAWPRKPLLAANAVSTSQPLAAQAGLQMLAAGGSAVDAILATAITLSLVEPVSNGIGSDAYAIVWDGRRLHGLNASGRSPAAWSSDFFAGLKSMPVRGWNSVSVPGCVSAWTELHARFGKLPFEKLFERAIGYGREGFLVSPTIAGQWDKQVPELKNQPGFAGAFMPNGRAPRPGERFTWKSHADVLEQIARTRGEAFYRGPIAERIEAHARKHDAAMRASDFAAHKSDWVTPLEMDYRGYTLHEIPPNGQGIVALIALGILEHFDLRSHPVDRADSIHLQIEAIKLAFADAWRYVADIDHMDVRPGALLDKEYLKARSKLIDPKRAQSYGPGAPPKTRTKHPGPRHQHQGPPGAQMQHTYAARIVGHGASEGGPIQPAELWPVTNSWRVSDHKTFTAVYAGANPDHHGTGRLVVFRQDFVHVKQTARDVDVKSSGPVTITSAPTGHNVGTSAQKTGEIQFRGANGVTGTLHLSNDTVSVGSG